jgi:hypothetical protein
MGGNDPPRAHGAPKPASQKAMLSRALQKANIAVQLDNAQNFEGAREAYSEACGLLQNVLQRTAAEEDKRKLEAIRRTYTSRINELDQMEPRQDLHKALPAPPDTDSNPNTRDHRPEEDDSEDEPIIIETASITRLPKSESRNSRLLQADSRPSLSVHTSGHGMLQSAFSKSPIHARPHEDDPFARTRVPDTQQTIPPLSPFRLPSSPDHRTNDYALPASTNGTATKISHQASRPAGGHTREDSQNSWLDPIDESDGSTRSSVHSRTSSLGYRRRRLRPGSGNTEIEFDTALDAAIEAAYDEGYEPLEVHETDHTQEGEQSIANVMRKVELARERVRQTEREAYGLGSDLDAGNQRQPQLGAQLLTKAPPSPGDFYNDNSSEEEEQLLDDIVHHGAAKRPGAQKSEHTILPDVRTSRASFESETFGVNFSSQPDPTSFAPEDDSNQLTFLDSGPRMPPPRQAVPDIPSDRANQTVRSRRLSGQNLKQLKIETGIPPNSQILAQPGKVIAVLEEEPHEGAHDADFGSRSDSMHDDDISPTDLRHLDSPFGHHANMEDMHLGRSDSPSLERLRENLSSASLKSLKDRSVSVSNLDEASDVSPGTPSSQFFGPRAPVIAGLPTPLAASFQEKLDGTSTAGMFLFDDNFHSPVSPGSPNPLSSDGPVSLEPCPVDFMLRPFWLMRCLYQTLVHARGGYLSTKLFIPREVWRVKGVKIRNVEDKIANCDYLTAALLKLAKVDTYDADAVLEEMQALEGVLEEVQGSLTRKLGNEVGVQGSGTLFREVGTNGADGSTPTSVPRSASVSAKSSSSFSWRRLRSKNSAVGLASPVNGRTPAPPSVDPAKDIPSLPTLPMTTNPTSRPAKRDLSQVQFSGPNANYMGSLARLFDAAQVIDQIARQVEDPGLRHADKTQVGLELCTRHAAEFFAFYICRFALGDLNVLLEKFLKRGSEWVLT